MVREVRLGSGLRGIVSADLEPEEEMVSIKFNCPKGLKDSFVVALRNRITMSQCFREMMETWIEVDGKVDE